MSYIFYLSYSRDDYSPYLKEFFDELCEEIGLRIYPGREQIGFLDSDAITISEPWRDILLNALQTGKVLVALCTPRYLHRESCGREVQFFLNRIRQVQGANSSQARYIVPVFWAPPELSPVPKVLQDIQSYDARFPDDYQRFGLQHLARMTKSKDDYREVLSLLAEWISETAIKSPELKPLDPVPSLDELPNAFAPELHPPLVSEGPESLAHASPTVTKARVFICYRRQETHWHAGWLNERMNAHLGSGSVFVDTESIENGEDFEEAINRTLTGCEGLVVLLGKDWLHLKDENGKLRLDDENDYVRREIATALAKGIRVLPILVDGASMPKRDQLPNDLKTFATRHAISTQADRFIQDTDRLMRLFKKS